MSAVWTDEENAVIREFGSKATSKQLAARLPGRTDRAVHHQRRKLGVKFPGGGGTALSPRSIGSRTLIAKTCVKCGLLLEGKYFRPLGHRRDSWCRFCRSSMESVRNVGRQYVQDKKWMRSVQEATSERATRSGQPYIEADFKVLADPSLTQVDKALALGRTYSAVSQMCTKGGYPSLGYTLGSPVTSAWTIENPNASRIAEIAAAIKELEDCG